MRLNINLATRTYVNSSRLNSALAALLFILVLILLFELKTVADIAGESAKIKDELAALERKSTGAARPVAEQDYQRLIAQVRYANSIISRKTYNWVALLDNLEAVTPDGIAITQIEPDPKTMGLKISGATLSFSRLRTLLENMEQSSVFTEIYLLSQAQAKVGESQKGMSFSINCQVKL
jgi:type IV pilus assembly protein PilN